MEPTLTPLLACGDAERINAWLEEGVRVCMSRGETGRRAEESIALSPQQHIVLSPVDSPSAQPKALGLKRAQRGIQQQDLKGLVFFSPKLCLTQDDTSKYAEGKCWQSCSEHRECFLVSLTLSFPSWPLWSKLITERTAAIGWQKYCHFHLQISMWEGFFYNKRHFHCVFQTWRKQKTILPDTKKKYMWDSSQSFFGCACIPSSKL